MARDLPETAFLAETPTGRRVLVVPDVPVLCLSEVFAELGSGQSAAFSEQSTLLADYLGAGLSLASPASPLLVVGQTKRLHAMPASGLLPGLEERQEWQWKPDPQATRLLSSKEIVEAVLLAGHQGSSQCTVTLFLIESDEELGLQSVEGLAVDSIPRSSVPRGDRQARQAFYSPPVDSSDAWQGFSEWLRNQLPILKKVVQPKQEEPDEDDPAWRPDWKPISLSSRSKYLFPLTAFTRANKHLGWNFCADSGAISASAKTEALRAIQTDPAFQQRVLAYWREVECHVPVWSRERRRSEQEQTASPRETSIAAHGVALAAVGILGARLLRRHPDGHEGHSSLELLERFNWSRQEQEELWVEIGVLAPPARRPEGKLRVKHGLEEATKLADELEKLL